MSLEYEHFLVEQGTTVRVTVSGIQNAPLAGVARDLRIQSPVSYDSLRVSYTPLNKMEAYAKEIYWVSMPLRQMHSPL